MKRPSFREEIELEIVDPLCDSDWDRLVLSNPDFSFFHSSAWAKILCKTYNHKAVYLRFSRGRELVALVPMMEVESVFTGRRGVCLPFSDFCGPLMFHKDESVVIVGKLRQLARERNWRYFELRGGRMSQPTTPAAATFYGHELDISRSSEELFARLASSVRRAIRKAVRNNLRIHVTQAREAMLSFYKLHIRTRRRHGLPPQPFSFFLNIQDNLIKPGLGFVVLAQTCSRPVAAAVFMKFGKKAVYKYGASDERLQQLRGSNLVMWEGINFLAQNGSETLHLGRTAPQDVGLRRFKLSLGASEEIIEYFRFHVGKGDWVASGGKPFGAHKKIFSRLPLSLNRVAGAMIYPHLD